MCPDWSSGLWRGHTKAGSWQKLQAVERSPRKSGCSGRACDPMGDPHWSSLFLKECTLEKGPTWDQFVKNCSPWKGPTLEKFIKDCIPWEAPHAGAGEEHEQEGAADTKHYELISAKLLKVKGSGAEARAEGPFLRWQNRSGEAAKSAEREREREETPAPPPQRESGKCQRAAALTQRGRSRV